MGFPSNPGQESKLLALRDIHAPFFLHTLLRFFWQNRKDQLAGSDQPEEHDGRLDRQRALHRGGVHGHAAHGGPSALGWRTVGPTGVAGLKALFIGGGFWGEGLWVSGSLQLLLPCPSVNEVQSLWTQ